MRLGQWVTTHGGTPSDPPRHGSFVGTACVQHESGEMMTLYVVRLDEGFYDTTKTCWVTLLLVHPDHVRVA